MIVISSCRGVPDNPPAPALAIVLMASSYAASPAPRLARSVSPMDARGRAHAAGRSETGLTATTRKRIAAQEAEAQEAERHWMQRVETWLAWLEREQALASPSATRAASWLSSPECCMLHTLLQHRSMTTCVAVLSPLLQDMAAAKPVLQLAARLRAAAAMLQGDATLSDSVSPPVDAAVSPQREEGACESCEDALPAYQEADGGAVPECVGPSVAHFSPAATSNAAAAAARTPMDRLGMGGSSREAHLRSPQHASGAGAAAAWQRPGFRGSGDIRAAGHDTGAGAGGPPTSPAPAAPAIPPPVFATDASVSTFLATAAARVLGLADGQCQPLPCRMSPLWHCCC